MRRCARARRDGSISRERRSSSGGRKEDGRSPTLRGISQDEHESITCSSRLTFILGPANERFPSFQFVLLFPLQSSGGTSVPHIPLLVARWSSPLPGPICFLGPLGDAAATRPRPPLTNRYSGAFRFTKRARPRHTMCATVSYTGFCERKAPLLSVCLCFTPLEAERCASVASSPSLWPGGAPLSPGRSVFMPLASSNPPRQCMEPAPTQRPQAERQSGRTSA